MSLKHQVFDSIRWLAIAQIASQVLRTLVSIYVIRNLQSTDMALVAITDTIIGFFDMFSTFGLGAAIVSRKQLTERDISNIAGMVLLINLVIASILLASAGLFATFYRVPDLQRVLQVYALGSIITALQTVPSALLSKAMRFCEMSLAQVISSVIGAVLSVVLVTLGYGYWAIVVGGLGFLTAKAIGIVWLAGGLVMPTFAIREARRHISFVGLTYLFDRRMLDAYLQLARRRRG